MTQQELVEQNIRMLLGDLQLQLVLARAELAALKEEQANAMQDKQDPTAMPNGKFEEPVTRQ